MGYKVISRFRDADGQVYEVGEEYPKKDIKATKKRIDELSSEHPKYRRTFIGEVEDEPKGKSKKSAKKE